MENGDRRRIIRLGESDIAGLNKTWGISRLIAELDERGLAERELGYDDLGRLIHRWPGGDSQASNGILDLAKFTDSTRGDLTSEKFETLWQRAIQEEAFFAEHDPAGDRFATSIPWWGCTLALAALAAGVWALTL